MCYNLNIRRFFFMNDKDLVIKFTDTMYATKKDVIKALNTSLIDPFWTKITEYRNQYKKTLSLLAITKTSYFLVMTTNVTNSLSSIQNKLSKLAITLSKLPNNAIEKTLIRDESCTKILKAVASINNISPSDITIANILAGRQVSSEYNLLVNYYECLKSLENHYIEPYSEDCLGEYLSLINGNSELTKFYRTEEINNRNQNVVIGRQYSSAPCSLIDYLMNNSIDFANNSSFDYIIRAFSAYFSINSIKPFEQYNEELSILMLKKVLAPTSLESLASILPLEEFLNEDPAIINGFNEAAKTRDLTYLLIAFLNKFDKIISTFYNRIEQIQLSNVKKEYYHGADEQSFIKEINTIKNEQPTSIKPIVEPKTVKSVEVKKEKEKETNINIPVQKIVQPSINNKDYDSLAEDLLESDPLLRPAQAAFYVRHCTVGKYYTIAQYKKATGCVYETARTSMDNLAKRGYYKREPLKNKFIYTPIPKE